MQKIYYFLPILVFVLTASCLAKITTAIGSTQSTLRYNGGKRTLGQYIGIGFEANPYSFLLGFETAFVAKNVLLTNKTWPSDVYWQTNKFVMKGDIPINGSYWESCFKIGYKISLLHSRFSIGGYVGPMISKQIDYTEEFQNVKIIPLSNEEIGKYNYDFHRYDSENFPFTVNRIIGGGLYYKNMGIEARLVKSYTKQDCFHSLFIQDYLDAVYFLFSLKF